jgi:hypothetical protein
MLRIPIMPRVAKNLHKRSEELGGLYQCITFQPMIKTLAMIKQTSLASSRDDNSRPF